MNNVNNLPAMNNAPHWNQQAPMMLLRADVPSTVECTDSPIHYYRSPQMGGGLGWAQGRISARDAIRAANTSTTLLLLSALTPEQLAQVAKLALFRDPFTAHHASVVLQLDPPTTRQLLQQLYNCGLLAQDTPGRFTVPAPVGAAAEEHASDQLPDWENSRDEAEGHYVAEMLRELCSWADLYYTPQYVMLVMQQGTSPLDLQQTITWLAEGRVQLRGDMVPYLFRLSEDAVWVLLDRHVSDMPYTGLRRLSERLKGLAGGDSYRMAAAALLKARVARASAWSLPPFNLTLLAAVKPLYKEAWKLLPAVPADQQSVLHKSLTASCLLGMAACSLSFPDWWNAHRESQVALQLLQEGLGPHHPGTIRATLIIAYSSDGAGHAGAEALFRQALEMGEQQLGDAHPETLTARNMLGQWLCSQGRAGDAQNLGYTAGSPPVMELLYYKVWENVVPSIATWALNRFLAQLGI